MILPRKRGDSETIDVKLPETASDLRDPGVTERRSREIVGLIIRNE